MVIFITELLLQANNTFTELADWSQFLDTVDRMRQALIVERQNDTLASIFDASGFDINLLQGYLDRNVEGSNRRFSLSSQRLDHENYNSIKDLLNALPTDLLRTLSTCVEYDRFVFAKSGDEYHETLKRLKERNLALAGVIFETDEGGNIEGYTLEMQDAPNRKTKFKP